MWNDLSMADKAKYIKLAVQNKVTSLSDIIDTYNIYANGGNIYDGTTEDTQQMNNKYIDTNSTKDNSMPWYKDLYYSILGTPKYNTPTLKEAIFKAYDNNNFNEPIIWNGNAYMAKLNDADTEEYKKSRGIEIPGYFEDPVGAITFNNSSGNRFIDAINKEFSKYPTSPNDSYEGAIEWANKNGYIDYMLSQARAIQKGRVLEALAQDPVSTNREHIPLKDTYDKSLASTAYDLRNITYDPDIIDLIATNLPEGYDIYEALTLPIHETHLGQGNKGTNLSKDQGLIRALINNHNYELDLGYFSDVAQHMRNVWRRSDGSKDDLKRLQKYITGDLDGFKRKYPDLYRRMEEDAKLRFLRRTFNRNNSEYKKVETPYIKHALNLYRANKYNLGEGEKYIIDTKEYTRILKRSKALRNYLLSKDYIK